MLMLQPRRVMDTVPRLLPLDRCRRLHRSWRGVDVSVQAIVPRRSGAGLEAMIGRRASNDVRPVEGGFLSARWPPLSPRRVLRVERPGPRAATACARLSRAARTGAAMAIRTAPLTRRSMASRSGIAVTREFAFAIAQFQRKPAPRSTRPMRASGASRSAAIPADTRRNRAGVVCERIAETVVSACCAGRYSKQPSSALMLGVRRTRGM